MKSPFNLTNKKQVIKFEEQDPYNPQNTLKGYINRRQGQLYGALWITHVNNKRIPQLIYSAPKQHYPFDKDKTEWKFPGCDYVDLYEKLDGTCIISYVYKNEKGEGFLTYKTRLRPFLGSSKFGNFFELWNEMLDKYPRIKNYTFDEYHNYVFELYGKRNKILIDYDTPLNTKLIFTVNASNGQIYTPELSAFYLDIKLESKGMLMGWHKYNVKRQEELYLKIQEELELMLKIDEETKSMKGMEGYVWYFVKDGHAVQIKCKPPSVLKYHWSGDAVSYESIYTTIINAFENFDTPTHDDIVSLLKEEFDEGKIEKSRGRIEKLLGKILFDKKLQRKVAEEYKRMGVNINEDKITVMRWFGKNYPKSESSRIYRLLKQYEDGEIK